MGDFSSFQITTDTTNEVMAVAKHARATATSTPQATPQVQVSRKVQVDTLAGGQQIVRDLSNRQVQAPQQARPGNVIIPGVGETTIEAAKAAGLLPPGFDEPAGSNASSQSTAGTTDTTREEQPSQTSDATGAAARVLDSLTSSLGVEAVESTLWAAAETGDFEAGMPAEGVSQEQYTAVVDGFMAQANATLGSLDGGAASVAMLSETLNDSELREARMATITNDKAKLAHLGSVALARMEGLPYQDPAAFEELIAEMPADERKALSQNEHGEWVVKVPGRPAISFGAAVRAGIVRVG